MRLHELESVVFRFGAQWLSEGRMERSVLHILTELRDVLCAHAHTRICHLSAFVCRPFGRCLYKPNDGKALSARKQAGCLPLVHLLAADCRRCTHQHACLAPLVCRPFLARLLAASFLCCGRRTPSASCGRGSPHGMGLRQDTKLAHLLSPPKP